MQSNHLIVGVHRVIECVVQVFLLQAVVVLAELVQIYFGGMEGQATAPAIQVVLYSISISSQGLPFVIAKFVSFG